MKVGVIGAGRLGITFALLCEKAGYKGEEAVELRKRYLNTKVK
jgi:predicted dinucleotide-binding enzyme